MAITSTESLSSIVDLSRRDLRVVVSGNGAVPWTVLRELDAQLPGYRLHMLNAPAGVPDRTGVVLESAFVGVGMRRSDRLAYIPCRLSQVPRLFAKRLPPDIVLVHTSAPVNGKVSLGIEVNILPAAIEAAKARGGLVIAQVNRHMPYTYGDGEYDLSTFDALIEVDEPFGGHATAPATAADAKAATPPPAPSKGIDRVESARTIGRLVSDRILDGSTLQMGIGEIPDATLAGLERAKNNRAGEIALSVGESHEQLLRLMAHMTGNVEAAQDWTSEIRWAEREARTWAGQIDGLVKLVQAQIIGHEAAVGMVPGLTDQQVEQAASDARRERSARVVASIRTATAATSVTPTGVPSVIPGQMPDAGPNDEPGGAGGGLD